MRVHDRVDGILQKSEQCRNSDMKLLINFWYSEGLVLTDDQIKRLLNCTPAESITRARRLLRAKYPASKAVTEERYKKFKEYKGGAVSWL